MRRIDTWVGKPLIWLLARFTPKARSLHGDWVLEQPPKRVICAKFIGLGSVVLALPMLKALKESGARVAFWSFPGQAELVQHSGYVDEIYVIRPSLKQFLPSLIGSWLQARRFKADAFLDLEPTANFTAILARLSNAPVRAGFMSAKPLRESLFTHLVALTSERHMVEHNLIMTRFLGIPSDADVANPLPAVPDVVRNVQSILPPSQGRRRIVLNVNSSDLSWHRMWPDDHWIALAEQLLRDPEIELIFPGAPSERERVGRIAGRLNYPGRVFNLSGKTTLLQLIRVLLDAELVVSVDSGIMHLAAWMGAPLLGMFGPETPSLYAPRSPRSRALSARLPCSPCLSVAADKITRCQDNQCMKRISPREVYLASRVMLERFDPRKISAAKTAASA